VTFLLDIFMLSIDYSVSKENYSIKSIPVFARVRF